MSLDRGECLLEAGMMIIKPGYAGIVYEVPEDTIIADIGFGHDPIVGGTYYIDRDLGASPDRAGRTAAPVPKERFIQADVSQGIPLPDKSCDLVIASHIVEHLEDPGGFCTELSRIGKAGYIETPGIIQELIDNKAVHKWYVTKIGNTLYFIRKPGFIKSEWSIPLVFPVRVLLYLFRQTCYHWTDEVKFCIAGYGL